MPYLLLTDQYFQLVEDFMFIHGHLGESPDLSAPITVAESRCSHTDQNQKYNTDEQERDD